MLDPCTFVIFGATGNLSQKKLMPALYHLEQAGRLPAEMRVLGVGRRDWDDHAWCKVVEEWLAPRARDGLDPAVFARFSARLRFFRGDLDDLTTYTRLRETLAGDDCPPNIAFYMAVAPADFGVVSNQLAEEGLNRDDEGWRRVVIEKPFGYDLESAEILNKRLHRHWREDRPVVADSDFANTESIGGHPVSFYPFTAVSRAGVGLALGT
ncbi:MAG: hypothetical protein WCZ87_08230, partial [Thiohalobacteraceae bacterium]